MMRSSVVLPEPDGPSSASSSPARCRGRDVIAAPCSAEGLGRRLERMSECAAVLGVSAVGRAASSSPCRHSRTDLSDERDEGEAGQQRGDGEGGDEVVFIVEDLDVQRHGVGQAADVAGDDRDRAELAHGAGVAEQDAVEQRPA